MTRPAHPRIALIAAVARHGVIGSGNKIPWHLPADLQFFKRTTSGHTIIMGRKTWDSIGKPLPNRHSVVITRSRDWVAKGYEDEVEVAHGLTESLDRAAERGEQRVFVIGGGQIYRWAIGRADRIYLTRVDAQVEGDVTFPELDETWERVSFEERPADERNPHDHVFEVWERRPGQ